LSNTPSFAISSDEIKTHISVINFGRDPGRIIEISVDFIEGDLPAIPNFKDAQVQRPAFWMLPVSTFRTAAYGVRGFPFTSKKARAKFLAVKLVYEWDFWNA